jgi:altronate dehydratase
MRTMAGYLAHPFVAKALLLEHGCEKTHNDAFRKVLRSLRMPEEDYAFRSVQLDGGIERVTEKSVAWFREGESGLAEKRVFSLGLHGRGMPDNLSSAFAIVASAFEQAGAAVVRTWACEDGRRIGYGERITGGGVYQMECPTDDDLEIVTGLGATGVQMLVVYVPGVVLPGNPVAPTIQMGAKLDLEFKDTESAAEVAERLFALMRKVKVGERSLASERVGNIGFQITRGYEGISL